MQHSTFRVASLANARAFLISSNFFRRLSSVSGTVGSFCCLQVINTVFEDPSKHTNTISRFHSGKMFVDTTRTYPSGSAIVRNPRGKETGYACAEILTFDPGMFICTFVTRGNACSSWAWGKESIRRRPSRSCFSVSVAWSWIANTSRCPVPCACRDHAVSCRSKKSHLTWFIVTLLWFHDTTSTSQVLNVINTLPDEPCGKLSTVDK